MHIDPRHGAHTLQARAYDAANNVGSNSISVNVQNSADADLTAPTVAIRSPSDGTKITSRVLQIYVVGTDNIAVTKLELFIDGKFFDTSTAASTTFKWNTMKAAAGAHTLQAYAYDAAGNVGFSTLVTVSK